MQNATLVMGYIQHFYTLFLSFLHRVIDAKWDRPCSRGCHQTAPWVSKTEAQISRQKEHHHHLRSNQGTEKDLFSYMYNIYWYHITFFLLVSVVIVDLIVYAHFPYFYICITTGVIKHFLTNNLINLFNAIFRKSQTEYTFFFLILYIIILWFPNSL